MALAPTIPQVWTAVRVVSRWIEIFMIVGVPKETYPGERRVAFIPAGIPALRKGGMDVHIERGAGVAAGYPDDAYTEKGGVVAVSRAHLFEQAHVIAQIRTLGANPERGASDLPLMRPGQSIVGMTDALANPRAVRELNARHVRVWAMELMPRITRAQSMDVLSSMGTIIGYKAVLMAADALPKMFPMLMTAAGTVTPARVLVIGAGVAGLQAISMARRLGAAVEAYDLRPTVKEQVLSLGARFVDVPLEARDAEDTGGYAKAQDESFYQRQRTLLTKVVGASDVVIATATIPGHQAPVLITTDMVGGMAPGSVILDLAAERGGNCEATQLGQTVVTRGVTIIGPENLASTVPYHASQMYSKNMAAFLLHLVRAGDVTIDPEDDITRNTLLTRDGDIVHPGIRDLAGAPAGERTEER